jgi:hypothetical protein
VARSRTQPCAKRENTVAEDESKTTDSVTDGESANARAIMELPRRGCCL